MGTKTESFFGNTKLEAYGGITKVEARGGGDLVVGGSFVAADGNPADRIAILKGTEWTSIYPDGEPTPGAIVYDMITYKGDLYIGTNSSAGGLAKLNTKTKDFETVGSGTIGGDTFALTIWDGKLVLAGSFTSAGGVSKTFKIAAWDGDQYISLISDSGTGPDAYFRLRAIEDVVSFKGELYVVGRYRFFPTTLWGEMAKFTGTGWTNVSSPPLPSSISGWTDMIIFDGFIWMAGASRNNLRKFPGDIDTLFTGVADSLGIFKNQLVMGSGGISDIDGVAITDIGIRDKNGVWSELGDGFSIFVSDINSILEFKGSLYICGDFRTVIDGDTIEHVLKLDFKNNVWVKSSDGTGLSNVGRVLHISKKL